MDGNKIFNQTMTTFMIITLIILFIRGCLYIYEVGGLKTAKGLFTFLGLIVIIILILLSAIISVFSTNLPRLPYLVRQQFQQDSVYRWFLSKRIISWVWANVAVGFQLWIILLFLKAGDYTDSSNLWLYTKACPMTSTTCEDNKQTNLDGWCTFGGIL